MKPTVTFLVLAAGMAASTAAFAQTEQYPRKPIRIVVPYAPGGPADILARLIGLRLNEAWKQPVIVDNRPGGNTIIGAELVARAQPDGYTLLVTYVGTLAINPVLYQKLPYDTLRDFAPITMIATLPLILVVTPSLPANSVKELIALAKSQPGKLTYSSGGVGQGSHLAAELFSSMTGTKMTHVPYKGNAPAVADVVGGHISMIFDGMSSSLPHVRSGRLRALGVTTAKRSASIPELNTIEEAGVSGYDVGSWVGLLTTAGTPKPIIARLNQEVVRILELPESRERLFAMGHELQAGSPEQFHAYIKSEITKWAKVVKDSGAKAE
jgi:tripartite-type tricarboxylate transporter receptor subunit TctC